MKARFWSRVAAGLLTMLAWAGPAAAQSLPAVDAVVGNNFGHLPMFVGVEKGLFKKHGVDVRLKVVDTGTHMVAAMEKREVQIGDMSVTTFLKARHAGQPFLVVGMIMNDATTSFADNPLAIVAREGSGIKSVQDLVGKRVGLAKEQTSDEYFKMVLARRGLKYEQVNIENIMSPPALGPALAEGKVDAVVSWEPFNTMAMSRAPQSYEVLRGGGHSVVHHGRDGARSHAPERSEARAKFRQRPRGSLALHAPEPRRSGRNFREVGAEREPRRRAQGDPAHQLRSAHVAREPARLRERAGRSAQAHDQGREAAEDHGHGAHPLHRSRAESASGVLRGPACPAGGRALKAR